MDLDDDGLDPTAPPKAVICTDAVPADDPQFQAAADGVRLRFDRAGQWCGIVLTPRWASAVPPATLGATATSLLAHHRLTEQDWSAVEHRPLAGSALPLSIAHDLQADLVALQDCLVAELPAVLDPPTERVTSRDHRATVTVSGGRVVALELDPAWAETATTVRITTTVAEVLQRATRLLEADPGPPDPVARARDQLAAISEALDDYAKER